MRRPLLILSDAPTLPTGLGRITRDIATNTFETLHDKFRVGTYGLGETGTRYQPFMHYSMHVTKDMIPQEFPSVWEDFSGGEKGTVLCIWNPSWLKWLAQPEILPKGTLRDFLETNPFEKWIYAPVDGEGPNGNLPGLRDIFLGFDRILAYTKYGQDVIWRTLDYNDTSINIEHLPHGIDTAIFYPRNRAEARRNFVKKIMQGQDQTIADDVFMVGVVATNSPRKDFYLAFEACAELLRMGKNVGLWAHTDYFQRNWDLPSLMQEFGMTGRTFFSNRKLTDDEMAWGYSACDVTWLPSSEGMGYPIYESLACGIPCVHPSYAGGAEFLPKEFQVAPVVLRGEGYYGIRRPVCVAHQWAVKSLQLHGVKAELPSELDWGNLWPHWSDWLRRGIQ